jgi:hypothetical protein
LEKRLISSITTWNTLARSAAIVVTDLKQLALVVVFDPLLRRCAEVNKNLRVEGERVS